MIDDLNAYIGRVITSTCNDIGCADCPFSSCEVSRVQSEVAELERKLTPLAPDGRWLITAKVIPPLRLTQTVRR